MKSEDMIDTVISGFSGGLSSEDLTALRNKFMNPPLVPAGMTKPFEVVFDDGTKEEYDPAGGLENE